MSLQPTATCARAIYPSPLGPLTISASSAGLTALRFPERGRQPAAAEREAHQLAGAVCQLEEYFRGSRTAFELSLDLHGDLLHGAVWNALRQIPYGTTTTYAGLTQELGLDSDDYRQVRRVAAAIAKTPVPIVVPCHRVVGADGALTGYGGGLERKQALLDLERRVAAGEPPQPAWAFRQMALL